MENRNCFQENDRREAEIVQPPLAASIYRDLVICLLNFELKNVKLMSGSGTNRIADDGDGGFQILFFSLFAALSELYSQVDVSQWVDIFFEEAYLNSCICIFTRYF